MIFSNLFKNNSIFRLLIKAKNKKKMTIGHPLYVH